MANWDQLSHWGKKDPQHYKKKGWNKEDIEILAVHHIATNWNVADIEEEYGIKWEDVTQYDIRFEKLYLTLKDGKKIDGIQPEWNQWDDLKECARYPEDVWVHQPDPGPPIQPNPVTGVYDA